MELTIAKLKEAKPHFCGGGNIKLGPSMGTWSTMKGSSKEIRYVPDFDGECSGTCGDNCKVCTKDCYVNKTYRIYPSVVKCHAINTTWLKKNLEQTFKLLDQQLNRKKKPFQIIRINQSGELTGEKELKEWIKMAVRHPETIFYLYTKNYEAVDEVLSDTKWDKYVPTNFTILISIWHSTGIECYNRWKHYKYIKAFVYDDGIVELEPNTYCMAYDDKGHMDHNVTCEKCRKCFNNNMKTKIIGCKAH